MSFGQQHDLNIIVEEHGLEVLRLVDLGLDRPRLRNDAAGIFHPADPGVGHDQLVQQVGVVGRLATGPRAHQLAQRFQYFQHPRGRALRGVDARQVNARLHRARVVAAEVGLRQSDAAFDQRDGDVEAVQCVVGFAVDTEQVFQRVGVVGKAPGDLAAAGVEQAQHAGHLAGVLVGVGRGQKLGEIAGDAR